jgi:hypothetical protein
VHVHCADDGKDKETQAPVHRIQSKVPDGGRQVLTSLHILVPLRFSSSNIADVMFSV